ncbi:Hydantoinase B/oxoprolinase [Pseudonocardia dioxanivorans CB1190]|uniref:Hydantoinase B/oxoprolinase n=1 Tax=Pseudonocardia dioxanivorans (strain ATCC 55486 / DSM 44775 / JCM 13855 / CB1190) TaxID=675635 RepID=F4CX30_PSEUX|nr:hydantoinase B/oxoprolinase family protein [Pseudonocardia dioxanivorans]AEA24661.1 Hydantoinase B/oxoprolinase [Pseudonocardia dioxanivorans CB1190]
MSTPARGDDAVGLEILRSAFYATVRQAGRIILRSSFSPIIRDAFDFCVTLVGPIAPPRLDLDIVAMNESLAHFSGVMPYMVRNLVWEYGVDNLRPGDLIAYNNPFKGGNHVYDNGFFRPVFHGGELIGGVAVKAHLVDMGGLTAGGYSVRKRSLFEEGVVISGVQVYRDDEPFIPGFNLYFDNSRLPQNMLADLQALHSAASFVEERLLALADQHGVETLHDAMAYTLDYADRSTREGLRALPDGDFVGEDGIDADAYNDEPYVIRTVVRKRGDEVEVDFSGTTREAASSVNCSVFDAINGVFTAVKFLCDPHNPNNAGAFRCVSIVIPEGTFVSARPPAATTMYFDAAEAVFNAVTKAFLSGAPAEAAFGGHYSTNMGLLITGTTGAPSSGPRRNLPPGVAEQLAAATQSVPVTLDDPDGSGRRLFVAPLFALGGFGASAAGDGESFVSMSQQNLMEMSAEAIEEDHPVMVLRKEFATDTAGPGEHRGGAGVVYDRMVVSRADVYPLLLHLRVLPWGSKGAEAGRPGGAWVGVAGADAEPGSAVARTWLVARDDGPGLEPLGGYFDDDGGAVAAGEGRWVNGLGDVDAGPGTLVRVRTPGAGGWGDPHRRDPAAVLRDVRDGYVSVEGARRDYGVAVEGDPETAPDRLRVDEAATAVLRNGGAR